MPLEQRTMTSVALQHAHTDIYKHFFHTHTLVLSTSHVLRRWPSISRWTESLKLKQKLPARMYAWISFHRYDTVVVEPIITYDQITDTYITLPAKQVVPNIEIFETCIQELLAAWWYTAWVRITLLSEYARGHGFWFVGIMSTLFASIVSVLCDRVDIWQITDEYSRFVETSECHDIALLASAIDAYCMWKTCSSSWYISLQESSLPIVHVSCPIDRTPVDIFMDRWANGDRFISKQTYIWIAEIAEVNKATHLPIDYGIIYFGTPYDAKSTYGTYENFAEQYSQTSDFLKELGDEHGINLSGALEKTYDIHNLTTFFSVRMLAAWKNILQKPFDKYTLREFVQTFIDWWLYNSLIEREYKNVTDTYYLFDTVKHDNEEKIWLIPLSSWKHWWSFIFVTPYQKSRETVTKLLDKLHEQWYDRACFEYLSWRDGQSHTWLVIDQYIQENIYSRYIAQDSVLYIDEHDSCSLINHSEILELPLQWIVLDSIYKKIYVNWKKLTHKDLRSQSTTVEVLDVLLDHVWEHVHNSEFPSSSYSKNKNEMLWKIVLPIKNLVKELFDIHLELECSWSIYDFHMKLNDTHNLFHRIRKIEE